MHQAEQRLNIVRIVVCQELNGGPKAAAEVGMGPANDLLYLFSRRRGITDTNTGRWGVSSVRTVTAVRKVDEDRTG